MKLTALLGILCIIIFITGCSVKTDKDVYSEIPEIETEKEVATEAKQWMT